MATTTSIPATAAKAGQAAPSRPSERPFLKGFETLEDELSIDSIPIDGQIPDWLGGQLVRTGPARFEVGGRSYRHWFDGLAMLHCFTFGDGKVGYRNRYLHSKAYDAAKSEGRITYSEFATDPCRSIFQRFATIFDPKITDNGNVNVSRVAGHYVAMTETPLPVEFDRGTLETTGVYDYDGDGHQVHHTTAHPHYDRGTGESFNYFAHYSRVSSYNAYRVGGDSGRRQVFGQTSVKEPGYIHSFGLTPNYFVLVEFPYVVNPLSLLVSGKPFIENFTWRPDRPARFLVFRRSDGELVREGGTDAFFAFHHVNAFEDGGELVVDIVAYDDPSIVKSLYLDVLRSNDLYTISTELRRYRVPLEAGAVTHTVITNDVLELPRINYARNGQDYRYAYFTGGLSEGATGILDRLVKVNVTTGATARWQEGGCYPGEAVFVATPHAEAEDDGVLLSVVLDGAREQSFLLVLDAATFQELGRATVPHHIPFGFHGQYFG